MRKDNTSGYVGVSFHRPTGKYQARVTIGRRAPNGIPPGEFAKMAATECVRNCADESA